LLLFPLDCTLLACTPLVRQTTIISRVRMVCAPLVTNVETKAMEMQSWGELWGVLKSQGGVKMVS